VLSSVQQLCFDSFILMAGSSQTALLGVLAAPRLCGHPAAKHFMCLPKTVATLRPACNLEESIRPLLTPSSSCAAPRFRGHPEIAAEEDWEFSQYDDRKTRSILTISRETIDDAIL
jgi:hypothetical protein